MNKLHYICHEIDFLETLNTNYYADSVYVKMVVDDQGRINIYKHSFTDIKFNTDEDLKINVVEWDDNCHELITGSGNDTITVSDKVTVNSNSLSKSLLYSSYLFCIIVNLSIIILHNSISFLSKFVKE